MREPQILVKFPDAAIGIIKLPFYCPKPMCGNLRATEEVNLQPVSTQERTDKANDVGQPSTATTSALKDRHVASAERTGLSVLWANRKILMLLTHRDVSNRYKGSLLGKLWPLLHPLGQLVIYTFVFSIVLKIRFGGSDSTSNFAIYFMAGMIPWSIFAESVSRAATCILENPNFVTKVVFPTEVLPLVNLCSAVCTQFIAFVILLGAVAIFGGGIHATLPLLLFPCICLVAFSAGASWILASLGVFVRDTRHFVSLALQAGMYATPILYPSSSVPKEYQWVLALNPLAGIIDDFRRVMLEGVMPDWSGMVIYGAVSFLIFGLGLAFFLKTKKSFADVM